PAAHHVNRYGKLPITALPPPPLGGRGLLSSPAEGSVAVALSCGGGSPRQRRVARWKNRLLGTRSTLSPPAAWVSSSVTYTRFMSITRPRRPALSPLSTSSMWSSRRNGRVIRISSAQNTLVSTLHS